MFGFFESVFSFKIKVNAFRTNVDILSFGYILSFLVLIVLSVVVDFKCHPARTSRTYFLLYIYPTCSLLGRNILPGMS